MFVSDLPRASALLLLPLAVTGVLAVPAQAATPTCLGRPATIVGTSGADTITGTSGPDVIVAGPGDDTVRAGGGDDLVCAGDGSDLVYGGLGADALYGQRDRYFVDRSGINLVGDTLVGGGGDDQLVLGRDPRGDGASEVYRSGELVSYLDSSAGVQIDLVAGTASGTTSGQDVIVGPAGGATGSRFADTIVGGDAAEVLEALAGSDVVRAGAGDDVVYLDPEGAADPTGDDVAEAGAGDDYVYSSAGADTITGDAGVDRIYAGGPEAGAEIDGGAGADQVTYSLPPAGAFQIAGAAEDRLVLYRGSARSGSAVRVDAVAGSVSVADGASGTLLGTFGGYDLQTGLRWTFAGSDLPEDVMVESGLAAVVNTQGGDDEIYGGSAGDSLYGGAGVDYTAGRGGSDLCRAERKAGCER